MGCNKRGAIHLVQAAHQLPRTVAVLWILQVMHSPLHQVAEVLRFPVSPQVIAVDGSHAVHVIQQRPFVLRE